MKKTVIWLLVLATLLAAGGLLYRRWTANAAARDGKRPAPSAPVRVASVVRRAMPVEVRTFGVAQAYATVAVRAQIGGRLAAVHVREGQDVKADDPLFTIDARPQEAALAQAEAGLAKAQAQAVQAAREARRQEDLLQQGFVAEDARDRTRAAADAWAAEVRAGEAQVAQARLQLEYCHIRAPLDGRAGALLVHAGNVVKANEATLLTLHQIQPMRVGFAVPPQHLDALLRPATTGWPSVRVAFSDATALAETGAVDFVDHAVDAAAGTLQVKAVFPNAERRLWPGLFVQVTLSLGQQEHALVLPSEAVQIGQQGAYVYVVKPDATVEDRAIRVERSVGHETIVAQGLAEGETVVTDGLRLAPGMRVEIEPTAGP